MAIAMLLGIPAAGTAEERKCSTIRSKTLVNVKVPVGASCTLKSVKVKGTVKVGRTARLEAIRVRVVGNVQAENARQVIVRAGSKVGGSIQIVQGRKARIKGTTVNGRHTIRRSERGTSGPPQRARRKSASVPEQRGHPDQGQQDRRQSAVQGEQAPS